MKYNVVSTQNFKKELKRLGKKHVSLFDDVLLLIDRLEIDPVQGTSLGNNFYKIRLSVKSKGKGKSGGARVITFIKVVETTIYLASIYDKSEKASVTADELKDILKFIP